MEFALPVTPQVGGILLAIHASHALLD